MTGKTRIVYIIPSLIKAGPVNVLYNIVSELDRERFDPLVVAMMPPRDTRRGNERWFTEIGVEVVTLGYSNWRMQLSTTSIAHELKERFDGARTIFHAHGYYPTLILAAMKGERTMTTIHNICDEDFRMQKGKLLGGYMVHSYKKALPRLTCCVTISDNMKRHYEDITNIRLRTIYNGVKECKPIIPQERAEARRALDLEPSARVLLYPAGFSQRKNQQFLIKAIQESGSRDVVVMFAGNGGMESACKAMAHGDSRFRFMGYRMDMEPLWQAADMMVSTSMSEGMPMAVLEAVLHGLPCLLSDIPPHMEILNHVFTSHEAKSLSFSLESTDVLADKLRHMPAVSEDAPAIISKASAFYSRRAMAEGYMQLYEEMISI